MKKLLLPILFSILLFIPLAAAEKGVGVVVITQSELVKENQVNCVNYSVYNPFSEDTSIYLTAGGALEPLVIDTQPVAVPANTTHDKAIPVALCFNMPKVYKEDCIAGMACKRSCEEPEVTYTGEAIAAMAKTESVTGGAGSATQAAAAVPLTLKVVCEPVERVWTPIIVIAILAVAAIFGLAVARRRKGIASA